MTGGAWRILHEASPGQQRALLYHGERICEAWHHFDHAPDLTGSVHKLRIDRVFAKLGRATARLDDGTPVSIRVAARDEVRAGGLATITISSAPRDGKPWQAVVGARLVGRDVILLPGETGIAESRQLESPPDDDVKARIAALCAAPPGFGVILRRTAGDGVDLPACVAAQIDEWRRDARQPAVTGCVYHGGDLRTRIGRAVPGVGIEAVAHDQSDAFDADWDEVVASTGQPEVGLAGGGRLWIEPTRALTAIDADSGDGSMAALLAEAPEAIAIQLRLRQCTGLVAIDMPRMAPPVRQKLTPRWRRRSPWTRAIRTGSGARGAAFECRIALATALRLWTRDGAWRIGRFAGDCAPSDNGGAHCRRAAGRGGMASRARGRRACVA